MTIATIVAERADSPPEAVADAERDKQDHPRPE